VTLTKALSASCCSLPSISPFFDQFICSLCGPLVFVRDVYGDIGKDLLFYAPFTVMLRECRFVVCRARTEGAIPVRIIQQIPCSLAGPG